MARVLPPLAICAIFFDTLVYQSVLAHQVGKWFALDWLASSAVWFVSFIVVMYLLFPLIYRIQKNCPKLIWVAIIGFLLLSFSLEAIWDWSRESVVMRMVSRIPVFLLGCALAPYEVNNCKIPRWTVLLILPAAVVSIVAWKKNLLPFCSYSQRMVCFVICAIAIILLLSSLAEFLSNKMIGRGLYRCIAFCGSCSLEMYLVFARIRELLNITPALHTTNYAPLKLDFIASAMTIPLSLLLVIICRKLAEDFRSVNVPEKNKIKLSEN